MHTPEDPLFHKDVYTSDLNDVIQSEKTYLDQRRAHYKLPELKENSEDTRESLWGISISGGGIRSATLGLGMLQKFIVEGIFKRFDYMSTVSGGGYIGSCISSLMNTDPAAFVRSEENADGKSSIPGMDRETSPFVLLLDKLEEEAPEDETPRTTPKTRSRGLSPAAMESEFEPQLVPKSVLPSQFDPDYEEESSQLDGGTPKKQSRTQWDLRYKPAEETRLDARHQLHHLRMHGEYLTPNKFVTSPDIQRAIGTVLAGIFHNFLLYILALTVIVCLSYMLFDSVSKGQFFKVMNNPALITQKIAETDSASQASQDQNVEAKEETDSETEEESGPSFWSDYLGVYFGEVIRATQTQWQFVLAVGLLGLLVSIIFILLGGQYISKIRKDRHLIRSHAKESPALSGYEIEDHYESSFVILFLITAIAGAIGFAAISMIIGYNKGFIGPDDYWLMISLPGSYSIGLFLGTYILLALMGGSNRTRRAFHGDLRGGALYGLLLGLLVPIGLLILFAFAFSIGDLFYTIASSLSSGVSIAIGYVAAMSQSESENGEQKPSMLSSLAVPVLSVSIVLFIILGAAAIALCLNLASDGNPSMIPTWTFLGALILLILLGYFVNANRLSLHYFFRDRLTEAYLHTNARVQRQTVDKQGMPLVNLRNDEALRLKDLGWRKLSGEERKTVLEQHKDTLQTTDSYRFEKNEAGKTEVFAINPRSPYHLIVTALNLQGSDELVRKDLLSEHFIFSRNYSGSNSTGYVRTDAYREGRTKLARAMTISAAAVSSGMGMASSFAQAFLTTILNLRLGYWTENPWFYRNSCQSQVVSSGLKGFLLRLQGWKKAKKASGETVYYNDPKRKYTFWPSFLVQELFGLNTANKRLVNVSDGGHTGDNLGLLPLLRRRCKVIVICDFEQDNRFTFQSFNHAIRMANIEENIDIKIDIRPLEPETIDPKNIMSSECSVVEGEVRYPDYSVGKIFYLKSSVALKTDKPLPVNVYNYHKKHPDFPHQSTADQYFDDAQFEAYRALGFHIAGEASGKILDYMKVKTSKI